jgi:hypothetical protein
MNFTELLKNENNKTIEAKFESAIVESENKIDEAKKPEEVLRGAGYKIKLVTPTSFGTQIDFAKKYNEDEIKDLLKDFTIKIKNKSVFIVD